MLKKANIILKNKWFKKIIIESKKNHISKNLNTGDFSSWVNDKIIPHNQTKVILAESIIDLKVEHKNNDNAINEI